MAINVGMHELKIVEDVDGKAEGRAKASQINLTVKHNRRAPLKIQVAM